MFISLPTQFVHTYNCAVCMNCVHTDNVQGMQLLETLKDTVITCQFFPTTQAIPNAIPVRAKSGEIDIGLRMCEREFVTLLSEEAFHSLYSPQGAGSSASSSPASGDASNRYQRKQQQNQNQGGHNNDGQMLRLNPPPNYNKSDVKPKK
jgi:hypothetical protein